MNHFINPISFFAIFKRLLSLGEVVRFADSTNLDEVFDQLNQNQRITKQGFNYSVFKEANVLGLENDLLFRKRLKIAKRICWWLRLIPSIRFIGIVNSLSFGIASPKGDIDLFIVTAPKTVSVTRAIVTFLLVVFRARPKGERLNPICASFFVVDHALDLSGLTIENDVYMKFWLASMLPLYDSDNILDRIFKINHRLIQDFVNLKPPILAPQMRVKSRSKILDVFLPVLRLLNPITSKLQNRFFSKDIRDLMNIDTRVVVNESVLKFHTNDRRAMFRNQFIENLKVWN